MYRVLAISLIVLALAGVCQATEPPDRLLVTLVDIQEYSGPCPAPSFIPHAVSATVETHLDVNTTFALQRHDDENGTYWLYETNDINVAFSHIKVYNGFGELIQCISGIGLWLQVGFYPGGKMYVSATCSNSSAWYFFTDFYCDENYCQIVGNQWAEDDCRHNFWATGYAQWHAGYDGKAAIMNPEICCLTFKEFANFAAQWLGDAEELSICVDYWLWK